MKKYLLAGLALLALLAISPGASLAGGLPEGHDEITVESDAGSLAQAEHDYREAYEYCMATDCLDWSNVIFITLPAPPGTAPTTPTSPDTPKLNCDQLRKLQAQIQDLEDKWHATELTTDEAAIFGPYRVLPTGQSHKDGNSWTIVYNATSLVYWTPNLHDFQTPSRIDYNSTRIQTAYDNVTKTLKEKCAEQTATP